MICPDGSGDPPRKYLVKMITGKDIGYDAYATRIAVYVDNTLVARFDNTRGSALNWQHAVARFTGNAGRRTIRIVTDAADRCQSAR
ncbi:hypothetical protein F2P44_22920 [Massilia sp. CCM 8695]|uniref:Uncharacterized protein n=2 Tax=Massilia frigida TaxID=2609281 RepID=A0ABX0NCQ3_9BURK|nr:hypothetical protein [Massilia frigida]